jgi:hypothetical protein
VSTLSSPQRTKARTTASAFNLPPPLDRATNGAEFTNMFKSEQISVFVAVTIPADVKSSLFDGNQNFL